MVVRSFATSSGRPDLGARPGGDPADADRLRRLVAATSRWCLQSYLPTAVDADGRLTSVDAASGRSSSAAALSLAVALRCGALADGVPAGEAEQQAVRAVRACAGAHVSRGGQWGHSWQSPLTSGQLGLAALVLGDALPADVRDAVLAVAGDEADFLAGVPVHYLRDTGGGYLTEGDTGAEEESWRARGLSSALALRPGDLRATRWHRALVLRALASYAPPGDVHSQELVHRSPLCSWLAGSNLEPNGDLQNHLVNPQPNYMRPVHHVGAMLNLRVAGQRVSVSLLRNLDLMYAALRRYHTEDGGLRYPAGTDVQSRAVILYANDVQHRALGIAPEEALRWERLHGGIAEGQVQPDGRIEEPGGTEPFGPVHPDIATKLAEALLALVLGPVQPHELDSATLAGAPVQQRTVACPSYGPTFADTAGAMLVSARWVASRDVLPGHDGATFRPSDPVPRQVAVLSIWRAAGRPDEGTPHRFDDVPTDGGELDRAVRWARATGVVLGSTASTLQPDKTLTRGQAILLLWRSEGARDAPDSGFSDVEGEVARAAGWARTVGITTGTTPTTFGPAALVNRGQWAVMLHRQHTA